MLDFWQSCESDKTDHAFSLNLCAIKNQYKKNETNED